MSYLQPQDSPRRLTGFALVVLMHVALAYALVNGLARKIVEVVQAPVQVSIIEEIRALPKAEPPPVSPPKPVQSPTPKPSVTSLPRVPVPETKVQAATASRSDSITAVAARPDTANAVPTGVVVGALGEQKARDPVRTKAVVDASACEKPEYPSAALRARETGIVLLSFLVGVDGKVIEGKVLRSSGYRRLDEAARTALAECRFKPATVDGKPEQAWAKIEYEWKME